MGSSALGTEFLITLTVLASIKQPDLLSSTFEVIHRENLKIRFNYGESLT